MGAVLGYDALCRGGGALCSNTSSPANLSDALSSPSSSVETYPAPPQRCASSSRCMERLGSESLDSSSKRLSLSSSDLQAMQDDVVVRSRSETTPSPSQAERLKQFSSHVFFNKEVSLTNDPPMSAMGQASGCDWRRTSSCSQASSMISDYIHAPASRLDFEVMQFFTFGSPLGIVLAHRKLLLDGKVGK